MTAYEIISGKRDGKKLSEEEIHFFINEFLKGKIKDYQMSSFLMAVYLNGMTDEETFALTESYIQSGKIVDLCGISKPKIDKHSTGGVGDKVSIVLAPLAASLGITVPMISGRGLGHTGGTLDKLESIPGFRIDGDIHSFRKQVEEIGVAIYGQTGELVPADRRIYHLRDATATIGSLPLITASILSKKIAAGIDGLVLDVKFGNGAFMKNKEQAEALAEYMLKTAHLFGKEASAFLTSMEQPLGNKIGNWLEILECIDCLRGKGPLDLREVVLTLGSEMLLLGAVVKDQEQAWHICDDALRNGSAFEKYMQLVEYQAGDSEVIESPAKIPTAKHISTIEPAEDGYVAGFDTLQVGMVSVLLGAGRQRSEDPVDPLAGIILYKKTGDRVEKGEPLCELHSNDSSKLEEAENRMIGSIQISKQKPQREGVIYKRIAAE